ncbi:MAG: hypothetical protein II793_01050 [Bacteroidales bacterium]|nr:hypothetical protein [Bacteroidales bacterium]
METAQQELQRLRQLLANYQELAVEQTDDDAYLARGNGFCDSKYSDDFLQGQIDAITLRIKELEEHIQ